MSTTTNQWMRLKVFGCGTKNTKEKKLRHRPLGFESMENRELMSVNPLAPAIAPWCDAVVCQGRVDDAPADDLQAGAAKSVTASLNKDVNRSNVCQITGDIFSALFFGSNPTQKALKSKTSLQTSISIVDGQVKIGKTTLINPNAGPQAVTLVLKINNKDVAVNGTLEIVRTERNFPFGKGTATTFVFKFKDCSGKDGAVVYTDIKGINNKILVKQHENVLRNSLKPKMAYLRQDVCANGVWSSPKLREDVLISELFPKASAGGEVGMSFQDGSHHRRNVKPPRPFVDRLADGSEGAPFQVGAMEGLKAAMPQRHELNRGIVSTLDVPTAPAAPAVLSGALQTPWAVTDQAFAEFFAD